MRPSLHVAKMLFGRRQDIYGVEVGVCIGENALNILAEWGDIRLIGVEIEPSYETKIRQLMGHFINNYGLIIADSVEAAELFDNDSLDFVYLDDDHSIRGVRRSINAWWPRVKPGGLLCGHDFYPASETEDGVFEGVRAFVLQYDLPLYNLEMDWWVIKPHP